MLQPPSRVEDTGGNPYAAANLLLILDRSDFISIDSWALKLASHEWFRGKPITAKEVGKRFEKWGEFKGFAFWKEFGILSNLF